MLHTLAISSGAFLAAGFVGPAAFRDAVSFKRHGALRFGRIGRLSFSWCIRKAPSKAE